MNHAAYRNIPDEMKQYPQFVTWRYEGRGGEKPTKVPYSPRTGRLASVTDRSAWAPFDDAIKVASEYDGIGFVFTKDDPFAGIDLDDASNDPSATERQIRIFNEADSYSEISPSGKGLHIIVKGHVPTGRRRDLIEVYSSSRFFTMTGNVYHPRPIEERQGLLERLWQELSGSADGLSFDASMHYQLATEADDVVLTQAFNANNGRKFAALWHGDASVINSSDHSGSAIDQALVSILQFYTKDPNQIERLWLRSPHGQREKTQLRADYRKRTIEKAFTFVPLDLSGPPPKDLEAPRPLRRQLPPPRPFPMDALGSILGPAAHAIGQKVQCADAVAAMSVLGAASLAVQAHADVVIPATGHAKPLSLFLVTIAASGERKSAADFEALSAIRQFEKELRDVYSGEFQTYRNKMDAWEACRDKVKRDKKHDVAARTLEFDALGLPPIAPLKPMLTCPEPTFEGLCRLYIDGFPALGIFSDEGGQFVGGHGLNPENRLRTIAGLSGLWDGTPIKRVRVIDGSTVLPGRRLALHLMMQPDVASTLLSDPTLKDQGFLSRILVAAPPGVAGTRFQRRNGHPGSVALSQYNIRLLEILRQRLPLAPGKQNELEARRILFDNCAISTWMDYADAVERRLGSGRDFEQIPGFANKLAEHAARIAGVLALVENLAAPSINVEQLVG